MIKLSERENAMVSGGSENNSAKPRPKYCKRCGRELKKSNRSFEEKYKGRLCDDCVLAIKIC